MSDLGFQFSRLNAAGNTFILCDLNQLPFEKNDRPDVVKKLCNQYVGFRSDGFIFLKKLNATTVEWDFYNSDGSEAEMCGNATRAVARFLELQSPVILKTKVGDVEIGPKKADSSLYYARWTTGAQPPEWEQEFLFQGHSISYDFFNTGVPHAIVEMDPYGELAKELRQSRQHSNTGMNVTFVESQSPGELSAVTFERGVEDFTLACGTGAVAAALWSKELNPELKSHQIQMPGGQLLVTFLDDHKVELAGPAELDFKIEVQI